MLLIQLLFVLQSAYATPVTPTQSDIDHAFELIFSTQVGQTVCRDILARDPDAIARHLGVSESAAAQLSTRCNGNFQPYEFVYPSAGDIDKLTGQTQSPRRYEFLVASADPLIESWTDSFENVTTILTTEERIGFNRLVQILAHETAVYFDSKINPAHRSAHRIPHLNAETLMSPIDDPVNPLVAVTNPVVAHTLTYRRALQVEYAIIDELVANGQITPPADYGNQDLRGLISEECQHECVKNLVLKLRDEYLSTDSHLPLALPMLAFASHYRALISDELPRLRETKPNMNWTEAVQNIQTQPLRYLRAHDTDNLVADSTNAFSALSEEEQRRFLAVSEYMRTTWWDLEWSAISNSQYRSGETFLEFMKKPLLSGYNILITSGPRVRIRVGILE